MIKSHIAVNAEDLSLQSLVITDSRTGDPPIFPALLKQINPEKKIVEIYGDGAYDTKGYYPAIHQRGAIAPA